MTEEPIEHDPIAEAADLLTTKEAKARVAERLRDIRALARETDDADPLLASLRAEVALLERAYARYS